MAIERFEDIEAWQLARKLAQEVFELARTPGLSGDFALKDQMSRSAGSAMDNIAEGFDSGSNAEFIRFLRYSRRSCTELQSQLYRALDRNYCGEDRFSGLYELARLTRAKTGAFIKYLSQNL